MRARACACGWLRPLFAVTTRSGRAPTEDLRVVLICPECGASLEASEVTSEIRSDAIAAAAKDPRHFD